MNTRRLLEQMARGSDPSLREKAERELQRRDEARRRAKAVRRGRAGRAPGKTKEERKAEHREETARLRAALILMAHELCERCRATTPPALGHMHHTIGGGLRRSRQSIENVAWLCGDCHRVMHKEPKLAREFRERLKLIRAFGQPEARASARRAG